MTRISSPSWFATRTTACRRRSRRHHGKPPPPLSLSIAPLSPPIIERLHQPLWLISTSTSTWLLSLRPPWCILPPFRPRADLRSFSCAWILRGAVRNTQGRSAASGGRTVRGDVRPNLLLLPCILLEGELFAMMGLGGSVGSTDVSIGRASKAMSRSTENFHDHRLRSILVFVGARGKASGRHTTAASRFLHFLVTAFMWHHRQQIRRGHAMVQSTATYTSVVFISCDWFG